MRLVRFVITAAVVAGMSGPALAQEGSGQPVATNPPANTNQNPNPNSLQGLPYTGSDNNRNWMASGWIGTNFGSKRVGDTNLDLTGLERFDTSTTSANFGGQFAYLGRGIVGGEFLADFSPNINTFNNVLFEDSPNVNTYMFNAIAAAPFGHHSYDPYVSGGIGVVSLRATIFTIDPTLAPDISAIGTESVSGSRFGWDLGGGVMAWSEKNWGFRGDVRYYRTTSSSSDVLDLNNIGNGDVFTKVELSGISFWKANAGLSFRW